MSLTRANTTIFIPNTSPGITCGLLCGRIKNAG